MLPVASPLSLLTMPATGLATGGAFAFLALSQFSPSAEAFKVSIRPGAPINHVPSRAEITVNANQIPIGNEVSNPINKDLDSQIDSRKKGGGECGSSSGDPSCPPQNPPPSPPPSNSQPQQSNPKITELDIASSPSWTAEAPGTTEPYNALAHNKNYNYTESSAVFAYTPTSLSNHSIPDATHESPYNNVSTIVSYISEGITSAINYLAPPASNRNSSDLIAYNASNSSYTETTADFSTTTTPKPSSTTTTPTPSSTTTTPKESNGNTTNYQNTSATASNSSLTNHLLQNLTNITTSLAFIASSYFSNATPIPTTFQDPSNTVPNSSNSIDDDAGRAGGSDFDLKYLGFLAFIIPIAAIAIYATKEQREEIFVNGNPGGVLGHAQADNIAQQLENDDGLDFYV